MIFEVCLGVLAALANALAVVGKPRSRLLDNAGLNPQIDQFTAFRYPFAIHDVEVDDLEWRRHFVFDDFYARLIADYLVSLLDRSDAPNIQANRSIKLQCVTARGRLRIAKHHADLEADLIDENHHCARTGDRAGQLAQRLTHEAGVQSHMAVAHLPLELGARHQGGDRIYDKNIDRA